VNDPPKIIEFAEWDKRYAELRRCGLAESDYGGPLRRHVDDGDRRLLKLRMDNSAASLRLWNFLLSEETRLRQSVTQGKKLVGTMKDLGTVPVMVYAIDNLVAFYPDGAWWLPCILENSDGLFKIADSLGIDDSFCPVRAMLGAFVGQKRFPIPDLLTCSVGATCDDFSAIAQRLESLGFPIFWWEMPHRRPPDADETGITLPGGFQTTEAQVEVVASELDRVRRALEAYSGQTLNDARLADGIVGANRVRQVLTQLRQLCFAANPCPMPALEMLIAEMLAIHFCSDYQESLWVLEELLAEVRRRVDDHQGVLPSDNAKIFWVNPVADLRVMNLLEDVGGRICGTDYMFCHAMDAIPTDVPPLTALAQMALADPMVGSIADRARRIAMEMGRYGAEGVIVSRIPGASHCAMEAAIIGRVIRDRIDVPVLEIEVPPLTDSMTPTIRTRLEALVETVRETRKRRDGDRVYNYSNGERETP
jgi:benzoyl-CoA reductase/2-hydroxyglutaryl-CoA dehydratase subunit BcrC/BadD/HgdB